MFTKLCERCLLFLGIAGSEETWNTSPSSGRDRSAGPRRARSWRTGHRVTVATRSGTQLPGAQAARADVVTGDGLETLAPGSAIVACCGITYTIAGWRRDWPVAIDNLIETAERQGATLVVAGNHYAYARGRMPMRATDPLDHPPSALGEVRAEVSRRLFAAHGQGRIRAVEVRGSSYLGADAGPGRLPGTAVRGSAAGQRATSVLRRSRPALHHDRDPGLRTSPGARRHRSGDARPGLARPQRPGCQCPRPGPDAAACRRPRRRTEAARHAGVAAACAGLVLPRR